MVLAEPTIFFALKLQVRRSSGDVGSAADLPTVGNDTRSDVGSRAVPQEKVAETDNSFSRSRLL